MLGLAPPEDNVLSVQCRRKIAETTDLAEMQINEDDVPVLGTAAKIYSNQGSHQV